MTLVMVMNLDYAWGEAAAAPTVSNDFNYASIYTRSRWVLLVASFLIERLSRG